MIIQSTSCGTPVTTNTDSVVRIADEGFTAGCRIELKNNGPDRQIVMIPNGSDQALAASLLPKKNLVLKFDGLHWIITK